jgi:hypothetical protein
VWRFFWAVTIVNVVIGGLLILAMPRLIPIIFGDSFRDAVPAGQVLLVGTTLSASRRIRGECARGIGSPGVSSWAEASMYPWLAVGVPWLMMTHGIVGLAAALTVGYALALWVSIVLTHRALRRGPRQAPVGP